MSLGTVQTQLWLRRPEQATRWCTEMLEPGRAVVLGLTRAVHDVSRIALLDTTGQILIDEPCTRRCLQTLVDQTARRIVVAYNQVGAAAAIERVALQHRVELRHLEETETWGCAMRARSAWLGSPDVFHPLQGSDALTQAIATVAVLQQIATREGNR